MRYTLAECRKFMLSGVALGAVNIDWFTEIPRLTKTEYAFHYLQGFIEGVFEW